MTMRDKTPSGTDRAMQRVWARNILKTHADERGTCDCQQCKDAKMTLKNY